MVFFLPKAVLRRAMFQQCLVVTGECRLTYLGDVFASAFTFCYCLYLLMFGMATIAIFDAKVTAGGPATQC
jgi:hypothetical protein